MGESVIEIIKLENNFFSGRMMFLAMTGHDQEILIQFKLNNTLFEEKISIKGQKFFYIAKNGEVKIKNAKKMEELFFEELSKKITKLLIKKNNFKIDVDKF